MKLERFNKNKKRNRIVIGSVIGILLVVGSVTLFRTFAFYEEKKEFNVLKGQIPSHWYDMDVLSVVVDGEEKKEIPERGLYKVEADCGDTKGEWDYNAWSLNLSNLKENTRCNVTFTSNALNEREYQQYIDAGKSLRRNTYRGKVLSGTLKETINGKEVTTVGEYTLDQVYAMISDGTFSDIYVGDVIVSNGITWLVADIDNYLYSGDQGKGLEKHHLTIIPSTTLAKTGMNSTNTIEGGYIGSEMFTGEIKDASKVTTSLPKLLSDVIEPAFKDSQNESHVIEYRTLFPDGVDMNIASGGYAGEKGASNGRSWVSRKLDLMTEMNVYGAPVWSSSGYETGADNRQYALFQLRPEMINSYGTTRFDYWLRNVSSSTGFARVASWIDSYFDNAARSVGIRPRFLIG